MSLSDNLRAAVQGAVDALVARGELPQDVPTVVLTPPKQADHGDFACSVALAVAKAAKKNPRAIADALAKELGNAGGLLDKTEIAGPGFLNLFVSRSAWLDVLRDVIEKGDTFLSSKHGAGKRVLVEYVSANPTGPLHVAHGRGAVVGDVVVRLLSTAGYDVECEYYVNDMGNQSDIMARSIHLRYGELHGKTLEPPEDFYPGEYIIDIAADLKREHGNAFVDAPESEWLDAFRARGTAVMLERIREDLREFGITFDRWVSERELTARANLPGMIERLEKGGHIFLEDGKKWFRTTEFGDDKDRVVVRDDGRTTYFASDIAYHNDKMERGFTRLINVWGADHGGYPARVKAGLAALGHDPDALDIIFIQMVSLSRRGEAVRMGKRLGTAVWLRDVVREAGRDATRYFFAMRRCQAQLDFDIELATRKSLDNPVYYAQMGHARMCSIERRALEAGISKAHFEPGALDALVLPEEIGLIKKMAMGPEVIASAADACEPHQIVHYLQELIAQFHSYYTQYKNSEKVVSDDPTKTNARLLLCGALRGVLGALLGLLGVDAPQRMVLDERARWNNESTTTHHKRR